MKRVKGEPHGSHFEAIYSDVDKFLDYVIGRVSLDNVFRMTQQPFADMGKQFIAGHLVDLNERLSIAVIQVMIGGEGNWLRHIQFTGVEIGRK
ncbi:MAG TPA: hypothetical protein ENF69_04785 [Euryarchaeota archaeon]|nr:hypothetical protein [Euryarchaeota archaeon]